MSSATSPVQLGPKYGAELLATFLAVALWGTTCMQTLIYFIQYPNDRLHLKCMVMWLWQVIPVNQFSYPDIRFRLANTAHEVLLVKGVYDSLVRHFGDYHHVTTVIPGASEYLAGVALTAVVSVTAQAFFTYRIWRFTGRRWFYWAILAPVALFELAGSFAFVAIGAITPDTAKLVTPGPSSIWISVHAVSAGADLTIAAGLIVLLLQSQGHALRGSRSVIHKLLILTINTGIWTALFAAFTLVAMIASKSTLIYAALYFPLCPLYCNTVLANLNAREFLNMSSMVTEGATMENAYHLGPIFASRSVDPTLTVHVDVNKSVRTDDDESALRTRRNKVDLQEE